MTRRVFALVPLAFVCVLGLPAAAESPGADLAEHGHWKRLKALVEPRAAANPNDAEAQWLLSLVRMAFHDVDGALAPAEKAAALDPNNAEYRWQVAQVVGEQAASAGIFKQLGLAKRFKREAEGALALRPSFTDAMIGLIEFYDRAPGIAGGDKNKAAAMLDQVSAVNKVDGCIARVRRLGRQSPLPVAEIEQVWVQAVQAEPSRYEPHINLASIYAGGDPPRLELAEKEALLAKKIDIDRVTPYAMLASIYATRERWPALDAELAEAEKQIPDNLVPYLRAAVSLLKTGKDLPRAERYARKYLSQDPEPTSNPPAVAHWRLGLILEKQGRTQDSIAELQTATRLDPKFEQAQKDLKRVKVGS